MKPLTQTLTRFLITSALLASLMACGGGQDPILGLPPGSNVMIDVPIHAPPDFTGFPNCTPTPVPITFNQAMAPETLNNNTLFLNERITGVPVPIDVGYDPVTFVVSLTPTIGNALTPGAFYDLTVISGIAGVRSATGGMLASDVVLPFPQSAC